MFGQINMRTSPPGGLPVQTLREPLRAKIPSMIQALNYRNNNGNYLPGENEMFSSLTVLAESNENAKKTEEMGNN